MLGVWLCPSRCACLPACLSPTAKTAEALAAAVLVTSSDSDTEAGSPSGGWLASVRCDMAYGIVT